MSLDYSKVIMVGNSWATRSEDGELAMFPTAAEAAGGDAEPVEEVVESGKPHTPLFDVFKITDGKRGKRASSANITHEEAEAYISERPDDQFEVVGA